MGKPLLNLQYKIITYIMYGTMALIIICILDSLKLLILAVRTKISVGNYINMVSENDGNVMPILLGIVGILSLLLNMFPIILLYKAYSPKKKPTINTLMFILILTSMALISIMLIICIMVLAHSYSAKEMVHDGIIEAMNNYSSNSEYKTKIDLLQLKFQCCGSKHYSEWYDIVWYDTNLMKKKEKQKRTPFSCCSVRSTFLCIHDGIESKTLPYKYSHELNFSISPYGCATAIYQKKKSVGWKIIGEIFLLILIQLSIAIGMRIIQTAHFKERRLGDDKMYTVWLIGFKPEDKVVKPPPLPSISEEELAETDEN